MSFYKNKNVLVAGGTGLIGVPLVKNLIGGGAKVRIASLDDKSRAHPETEFFQVDLQEYRNCLNVCKDMDYVFNLLCIKGSPKINKEKPASFFEPMILFNTNLLRAARDMNVQHYLFSSTYGVYPSAEVYDDSIDVLRVPLAENDFFTGLAKRVGEAQVRTYKIEYGLDNISIVRPSNTYGPFDNFNPDSSMVIPSLIRKILEREEPITIWGDGFQVRDFIYSDDVAKGMMLVMEKNPGVENPVNLGSGLKNTIKDVIEIILSNADIRPEIIYDTTKNYGDKIRTMDISRAISFGFKPKISLEEGIKNTMDWYRENKNILDRRFDIFRERYISRDI